MDSGCVETVARAGKRLPGVIALVSGAALLLLAPSSGQAAKYRAVRPDADPQVEPSIPNVPDRQGCIRICEFDLNPCDPPLYKKLDGRCTLRD